MKAITQQPVTNRKNRMQNVFNVYIWMGVVALIVIGIVPLVFPIAGGAGMSFGWLALVAIRVSVTRKVRLNVLIKKLLPTFLIAFSTASSAAALPTSMETCEKKLGIGKKLVDVGVPISNLFNKPVSFIERMVGILCMAELFRVDVTWSSLISMVITAFIFALCTPTIPGSGISAFTLMAQQFGVPMEAISIIIALDVITDRISTPTQVSVGQLELIQIANSLGSLDIETLRKSHS